MSHWSSFNRFSRSPKKPPPERGIRMKKAGTTWWGQRWIEALENVLRGDAARLARGRTYARAGRTHDLEIKGGKITAKVTGSRATPYKISIRLPSLPESAWTKAIEGMAQKAQFSAELLAGQMPQEIDEVFRDAGVSLFPQRRADLETSCSCPDWGDPCKHVAATHYVLGEALDRDPFLLFELRGKTKTQVLDALRAARGGAEQAANKSRKRTKERQVQQDEVPTVKLGKLKAADYDKPREPLPTLHFGFAEPSTHGAVLRQLGTPASWQSETSPADVLSPLVRAAAETARRIALAEPPSNTREPTPDAGEPTSDADAPNEAPPKRTRARKKAAKPRRGTR